MRKGLEGEDRLGIDERSRLRVIAGFAAFAAFAALATLAGCGGVRSHAAHVDRNPPPPEPLVERMAEPGRYGGRFVIGATASPRTFNALMSNEQNSNDVCDRLFASLTDIDNRTLADVPAIAKSWEWSADADTLTFHLRRGMRFSDGHPLTADDVQFSFDVAMDDSLDSVGKDGLSYTDRKTGRNRYYHCWAADSLTFRIATPRPNAMLLPSASSIRIMPKHVLEAAWKRGTFATAYAVSTPPGQLVTSGPWKVAEFVPDQKLVLEPNPWWFGVDARGRRLPYLDQLVFLIVRDQNAAALKFHAGDLDALDNVRPEDYAGYEAARAGEHFSLDDIGPSLNTNFLWFNLNPAKRDTAGVRTGEPAVGAVKYAWFSQPDFRRAISLAIDRDALIRGPFRGWAVPNGQLLTRGNAVWFDSTVAPPAYDPAAAKRLLAGLGLRDRDGDGVLEDAGGHPVAFTIITNADNTVRKDMATLVCDDLAKIGVHAVLSPVEMSTLVRHIRTDFGYDACMLGLGSASPPDPGMYPNVVKSSGLTHYWHVLQDRPGTPAEAKLDQLFDVVTYSHDAAERHRAYHDISTLINDQAFLIWLPTQILKIPVRSRFGNVEPAAVPHRVLWNIDRVFVRSGSGGA